MGAADPLTNKIAELEEYIVQQRRAFAPPYGFPKAWKLTQTEANVLRALLVQPALTGEQYGVLCVHGKNIDPLHNLRVRIFHLRHKLKPYGIIIQNYHSGLYSLDSASKDVLRDVVKEEQNRALKWREMLNDLGGIKTRQEFVEMLISLKRVAFELNHKLGQVKQLEQTLRTLVESKQRRSRVESSKPAQH